MIKLLKKPSLLVLFICSLLLGACTTKVEIELVEQGEASSIPEDLVFDNRIYTRLPIVEINKRFSEGFWTFTITTRDDIEKVILKDEMHHLYASFLECGTKKELLSGLVFPSKVFGTENEKRWKFVAYLKKVFQFSNSSPEFIKQELENLQRVKNTTGFCIKLGAGSMAGHVLTSNQVKIDLDLENK